MNTHTTVYRFALVALLALASTGQAASRPGSRLQAKHSGLSGISDWRIQAGVSIPGVNGSVMGRVYNKKFPIYVGAELDVVFWFGGLGMSVIPQASAMALIPTGGIATPTVGLSLGPSINLGGFGPSVGVAMLLKTGVLINLEKDMDLNLELRAGTDFLATVGMRFAL